MTFVISYALYPKQKNTFCRQDAQKKPGLLQMSFFADGQAFSVLSLDC